MCVSIHNKRRPIPTSAVAGAAAIVLCTSVLRRASPARCCGLVFELGVHTLIDCIAVTHSCNCNAATHCCNTSLQRTAAHGTCSLGDADCVGPHGTHNAATHECNTLLCCCNTPLQHTAATRCNTYLRQWGVSPMSTTCARHSLLQHIAATHCYNTLQRTHFS